MTDRKDSRNNLSLLQLCDCTCLPGQRHGVSYPGVPCSKPLKWNSEMLEAEMRPCTREPGAEVLLFTDCFRGMRAAVITRGNSAGDLTARVNKRSIQRFISYDNPGIGCSGI